jgi:CDP-diacylglycerol---glycerol-3-phosphate 3-phosphatidyltransferase
MAKIFSVVTKAGLARIVDPLARGLLHAGVTPNAVTVVGTIGVVAGALGLATRGRLVAATIVITLCALTDMVDGAMARLGGRASRFGALLDSTMDRLADGAVFAALTYWLATTGQRANTVAALLCLVVGPIVSYVKARAEGLGLKADVGIAERFERLAILGLGGLGHGFGVPYALEVALWLIVVLSVVTVGQRIAHVWRADRTAPPAPAASGEAGS